MVARNRPPTTESPTPDRRVYPLVALSVTASVFFFVQYELDYTPPEILTVVVIVGLTLGAPFVIGHSGSSFLVATSTGLFPLLGLQLGGWLDPPVSLRNVENMVNAFVMNAGLALPIVVISYIVGVGIRDHDALSGRKETLAIRLVVAILVALVVYTSYRSGLLSVGIDQ